MSSIKPILFNTEMTIAVLENRKTQTRRLVRFPSGRIEGAIPDPDRIHLDQVSGEHAFFKIEPFYHARIKSPYKVGDILYVRETFMQKESTDRKPAYLYKANPCFENVFFGSPWRPSIHMPKEAARIFLRVTDVRVERLQDIDGAGIKAEGTTGRFGATRGAFMRLWDSTVKRTERHKYSYRHNPWVWVYCFERCEKPEEWK